MTGFLPPCFRVQSFFHDDPTDYSGYTHAAKPDWIKIMWSGTRALGSDGNIKHLEPFACG